MATERMRNAAKKSFSGKSMNTTGSSLSKSKELRNGFEGSEREEYLNS